MEESSLSSLLKHQTRPEASIEVSSIASYYPTFISVYQPKVPQSKLKAGFELTDEYERPSGGSLFPEEDFERSLRRTKKSVRDYAICNPFNVFATFTMRSERTDVDKSKQRMSDWFHNQRNRKGKFGYLVVPEFHKDGKALHFHCLLMNYAGELTPAINANTGQPVIKRGRPRYNIPSYTLGFSDAAIIGNTPEDNQKLGHYISKYITKDMPRFFNKNRFWCSHGLDKPVIEYNPPWFDPDKLVPLSCRATLNGTFYYYDRKDIDIL